LSINNKNEYIRGAKFGIFGELTKLLAKKYNSLGEKLCVLKINDIISE
jgi:hypothetical protein